MWEIVNVIFYLLRGGIAWRLLPKDLPLVTTVYDWFLSFRREGVSSSYKPIRPRFRTATAPFHFSRRHAA